MTNYNERLDEIIQVLAMEEQGVADDFAVEAIDEGTYQVRDDVARNQAKQAITSLIKELVAEAMPEPSTNLTSYEAQMFIASTEEYRQNLLKALEVDNER